MCQADLHVYVFFLFAEQGPAVGGLSFMCSELSALLHIVGKNIVSHLRDKTCLCKEFQKGRCNVSGRSCYAGRQSCGHLLKAGRVCNRLEHSGNHCNKEQKRE